LFFKEISLHTTTTFALPDAVSAATKDDPRADYHTLSAQGLFFDQDRHGWVAASGTAVRSAFHCPELMVRPKTEPVPATLAGTAAADIFSRLVRMNDGPAHLALKTAMQEVLDSIAAQSILQVTREVADWFALPLPLDGPSVTRFNYGLPILVLAKLFGIDEPHWSALVDDVLAFVRCLAPGGRAEEIAAGIAAADRLASRIQQQLDMPGLLLQRLLQAFEPLGFPDAGRQWVAANAIGLWFQACEGCAGLIGLGLLQGLERGWQGRAAEWVEHVLNDLPPNGSSMS
jgi:cytochrome P450